MSVQVIDGKVVSDALRSDMKQRVIALKSRDITPGLAVILVGDNPASEVYVRNKVRACESIGVHSTVTKLPADTPETEVLDELTKLNADSTVHGILVQLPLPDHIDENKILETIDPLKDVDGFHKLNVGAMTTGKARYYPCTPHGVIKMLEHYGIGVEGKHAVVIGRSNIVGKPMSLMLLERGATVTICTSKTPDVKQFTRSADIVVAAVGKPKMIDASYLSEKAVVIDVGINRLDDGTLCGDVDYEAVSKIVKSVTPVPGGVGPMTITMLLENTIKSAETQKT